MKVILNIITDNVTKTKRAREASFQNARQNIQAAEKRALISFQSIKLAIEKPRTDLTVKFLTSLTDLTKDLFTHFLNSL